MFIVSKVNGNKILLFWKFCSHSFHCRSHTRAWLCWKKGWSRRICWGFHTPTSRLGRAGLLYPGCVTSSMFLMSPSAYVCFYSLQLLTKVLIYLRRKNAGKANWRRLRFLKTWLSVYSVTLEVWLYLLARLGNLTRKVDCRWIINLQLNIICIIWGFRLYLQLPGGGTWWGYWQENSHALWRRG